MTEPYPRNLTKSQRACESVRERARVRECERERERERERETAGGCVPDRRHVPLIDSTCEVDSPEHLPVNYINGTVTARFYTILGQQISWKPRDCCSIHLDSAVNTLGSIYLQRPRHKTVRDIPVVMWYSSRKCVNSEQGETKRSRIGGPSVDSSSLCRNSRFGESASQSRRAHVPCRNTNQRRTGIWPHCTRETGVPHAGQYRYEQLMVRQMHTSKASVCLL